MMTVQKSVSCQENIKLILTYHLTNFNIKLFDLQINMYLGKKLYLYHKTPYKNIYLFILNYLHCSMKRRFSQKN